MFRLKNFLLVAFCLFVFAPTSGRGADLSPYLDSETIAVVRVNLKQLDLPGIGQYYETAILKAFDEVIPKNNPVAPRMKGELQMAIQMALMNGSALYEEQVVKNKAEELNLIVYRDAMMKKIFPVLLAVPIPEGASQEQIDAIRMQYLNLQIPVTFVRHGYIVGIPVIPEQFAGQRQVMAFAREKFMEPSSQPRPEMTAALSSQPRALLQIVVGRIDQFQRDVETQINAFRPFLMMMPEEQQGELDQALKMIPVIFQSLNSYSFAYDYAKPEIRQVIQLKDEKTAKEMLAMNLEQMKKVEELLDQIPVVRNAPVRNPGMTPEGLAATKSLFKAIQMRQQGNDFIVLLDASGMEHLKTYFYEMLIKSGVAGGQPALRWPLLP